jgi:vitamin B12 transport system substrate-binding protein
MRLINRLFITLSTLLFCTFVSAKPVERIIALSPHSVELLFAIGAGDKIVATVDYADYPPEAQKIVRIGNYNGIQIEQVVALQPDLIVAWKSGNKQADLSKIESLGFQMVYTHPQTISQISDELITLGKLTGNEAQAKQAAAALDAQYQSIKQQYAQQRPVAVFYQLWHDPLRTVGPNSWIESLIRDCQGVNIFNDTDSEYPLVSIETVITKKPEVIIIPHHSGNIGAKTDIWQRWHEIPAVANKQVYTLNGDLLHRFGPRAVDGLSKLCKAIGQAR